MQPRRVLHNYHELLERRFKGDYHACDVIIDASRAIKDSNLTDRQREALKLVYVDGMTHEEAGKEMGITREAVSLYIRNAIDKIGENDSK